MTRKQRLALERLRDACDLALNAKNHAEKYMAGIELANATAALIVIGEEAQAKQEAKA